MMISSKLDPEYMKLHKRCATNAATKQLKNQTHLGFNIEDVIRLSIKSNTGILFQSTTYALHGKPYAQT